MSHDLKAVTSGLGVGPTDSEGVSTPVFSTISPIETLKFFDFQKSFLNSLGLFFGVTVITKLVMIYNDSLNNGPPLYILCSIINDL